VTLALAVVIVPLWHKRDDAIAMMNAADQAAIRAQQSDRLRSELDRMVGEYNFALERKYTTPGVAQVLDEVTRLLPDDTWLTQFEVKSSIRGKVAQRELFMRGESANAGKLISLLENATLVGNAAPRSPTTKLQPGPGESFDIGAQVKTIAMPQKVALTETVKDLPRPPPPVTAAPTDVPAQAAKAPAAKTADAPPADAAATEAAPVAPGHPSIVKAPRRGRINQRAARDAAAAAHETPAASTAAPAAAANAPAAAGSNGADAAPGDEPDAEDAQ